MKTIQVTNSEKILIVEDAHFERLSQFVWYDMRTQVARISKTCRQVYADGQQRLIHTPIANEVMQDYKTKFDHKDLNICNNLLSNLRPCTNSQNGANKKKRPGQTSIYKGVSYDKERQKWMALICVDYHRKFLGRYNLPEEAARAYDKAATKHFGEFAVLNFPLAGSVQVPVNTGTVSA